MTSTFTQKEKFNADKLSYVLEHQSDYPIERLEKDGHDLESMWAGAKAYLKRSRNSTATAVYSQKNGKGRHYVKGYGIQNMARELRHTICSDYYVDIDTENAGPTILCFLCRQMNIDCDELTKYGFNRAALLAADPAAKGIVIKIFNGGSLTYEEQRKYPLDSWLGSLVNEIEDVHEQIQSKKGEQFEAFKEDYKKRINAESKQLTQMSNRRIGKKLSEVNLVGKFVASLIMDVENQIVMAIHRELGRPEDAVLCFDGIMVNKTTVEADGFSLQSLEKAVKDYVDIKVKLKIKPMNEGFSLPSDIPRYQEQMYDEYRHYDTIAKLPSVEMSVLAEWAKNSLIRIDNGGKPRILTRNSNISIDAVTKEELKTIYYETIEMADFPKSLDVYVRVVNPHYDSNLAARLEESGKKATKNEEKCSNEWLYTNMMEAFHHMRRCCLIPSYNKVDFVPFLARNGAPLMKDKFNLFTGFPQENLPPVDIKFEDTLMYKHIKEELMNGDEKEFNHFMDHIADIIQKPAEVRGVGHVFYSRPGCGKSMLYLFMSQVIGLDLTVSVPSVEAGLDKFNAPMVKKLIKQFEEIPPLETKTKALHVKLKGMMSSPTEYIEPKGKDRIEIGHSARYWFNTNEENSLHLDSDDRRFTMHRCSQRYANNVAYFTPIWAEYKSRKVIKAAFDYFANRKYEEANVKLLYETAYKSEQRLLVQSHGEKFIIEQIDTGFKFSPKAERKQQPGVFRVKYDALVAQFQLYGAKIGPRFSANSATLETQMAKLGIARVFYGKPKVDGFVINKDDVREAMRTLYKNPTWTYPRERPMKPDMEEMNDDDDDDDIQAENPFAIRAEPSASGTQ